MIRQNVLLIFLWSLSFVVFSQEVSIDKRFNITSTQITLYEFFEKLELHTGCTFTYNSKTFNPQSLLNIPSKVINWTSRQWLDYAAGVMRFDYTIGNKQIAIRLNPSKPVYCTLSGYLKDSLSAEDLIGAYVKIKNTTSGSVSNAYGFYSITLPVGYYTFRYAYIGYESKEIALFLHENKNINIELNQKGERLEEIVIEEEKEDHNLTVIATGVNKIDAEEVEKIPTIFGEPDVLKTVRMLPGVQLSTELSSNFSVRGGDYDQNLILLDEATIYNPSHMLGLFSSFNNDAIKGMRFYKGLMPAKYGGRLSSVMDVRMKDGNRKAFSARGGIGFMASRLTVETPLPKEKGSIMLSGRRSYFDLLYRSSSPEIPYFLFYDLNGKVNYKIDDNNTVYLSMYSGRDVIRFNVGVEDELGEFNWGNLTSSFRWNHLYSAKLFSNFTFVGSRYNYETLYTELVDQFIWKSSLREYSGKFDFEYYASPESTLSFGYHHSLHFFEPGSVETQEETEEFSKPLQEAKALEQAIYLNNEVEVSDQVSISYGMRLSAFHNIGEQSVKLLDESHQVVETAHYPRNKIYHTYVRPAPRLGVNIKINSLSSLKVAYNKTVQYLHLASNSLAGTPLDIWLPSSPNLRPQRGVIYSLGYFRNLKNNTYEFSAESYYKRMKDQIEFADGANLIFNDDIEQELRFGTGQSVGLELMFKKKKGKFQGWLGYTLSNATRRINGINNNNRFLSSFDRPHNLSITSSLDLSKKVQLTSAWVLASGLPFTAPTGGYLVRDKVIPYYSERNGERAPLYHRLDLGVNIKLNKRFTNRFRSTLNVSVYNAYNRFNSAAVYFASDDPVARSNGEVQLNGRLVKLSLFSVFPTVTWNFSF